MDKLIPDKKFLTVEFKSDIRKLSDENLIDSVVAFANTEGGDLYLGVEDNGNVSGRHESHKDFTQLSAFIANKTIPPVSVIEDIDAELPVIKISVPKSRSIVASSSGKIQRRQLKMDGTPENIPMYPYEINTVLQTCPCWITPLNRCQMHNTATSTLLKESICEISCAVTTEKNCCLT